jgi:hypothetical protein
LLPVILVTALRETKDRVKGIDHPDVVGAFFAIQDDILTIKNKYDDDGQQTFGAPN